MRSFLRLAGLICSNHAGPARLTFTRTWFSRLWGVMIGKLLYPELKELIEQRKFAELRQSLITFPPADIAEILTDLTAEEKAVLLRMLPYQLAADVFEYLGLEDQTQLLHAMGREEVAKIINEMSPDDRTA